MLLNFYVSFFFFRKEFIQEILGNYVFKNINDYEIALTTLDFFISLTQNKSSRLSYDANNQIGY